MRVYTHLAPLGLKLAEAAETAAGELIFGRGTTLDRRHLSALREEGVSIISVTPTEAQPEIPPWVQVPTPQRWADALDERFDRVAADRRMMSLKSAIRSALYPELVQGRSPLGGDE